MTVTYGFYNSVGGDRAYNADQMGNLFNGLVSDGVVDGIGNSLAVRAGTGLQVIVGSGRAWFNGTWTDNDTDLGLGIDVPDMLFNRIDTVILEVNKDNAVRANSIKIVKGTPASSPVPTALTNDLFVHQYPLAYVEVAVGATELSGKVTNLVGTAPCPYLSLVNRASGSDVDAGVSDSKILTPLSLKNASVVPYLSPVAGAGAMIMSDGAHWIAAAQNGWLLDGSNWVSSNSFVSRAFTNDPASGANIVLNMADTTGFTIGTMVVVESSAGNELTVVVAVAANVSITVLYLGLDHTATGRLVTAINPNATVSVSGDKTGLLTPGDRVKLTQDGITKYFIVTGVGTYSAGATPITLYTGHESGDGLTNFLTNSVISSVYFSHRKAPVGFPQKIDRWSYEFPFVGGTFTKTSPAANTFYNVGNVGINVPEGSWNFVYKVSINLSYWASGGGCVTITTISPTNAETIPISTWAFGTASSAAALKTSAYNRFPLYLTSPSFEGLWVKLTYAGSTITLNTDATFRSILRLECAYL